MGEEVGLEERARTEGKGHTVVVSSEEREEREGERQLCGDGTSSLWVWLQRCVLFLLSNDVAVLEV